MLHINCSVLGNYFIDWLLLILSILSLVGMPAASSFSFVLCVLHSLVDMPPLHQEKKERRENLSVMVTIPVVQ